MEDSRCKRREQDIFDHPIGALIYINSLSDPMPKLTALTKGRVMSTSSQSSTDEQERIPVMQRILDNPFLLLFLGVTIPTVLYILWGVMEIASVPLAK